MSKVDWDKVDAIVYWRCPKCSYESIPLREIVSNLPICPKCTYMSTLEEYLNSELGKRERQNE